MPSPIQVTNDDIKALKADDLVKLLWQLVNLELATNQIQKYDSNVPLSIYIKDGGIDGLAKWEDGPAHTSYLPKRLVGFQAKATDMSKEACASEVQMTDGRLKPQVRTLVESEGVYVLFFGRDCVDESKTPRIRALKDAIEKASAVGGGKHIKDPEIMIYDATQIAAWANTYPSAIATIGYFLGKPYGRGMGWIEMSIYPDFQLPYVESDPSRITAIKAIREASLSPRNSIRVIGLSGLGKTRLVFEAFRPPPTDDPASNPEQARLAGLYCYISAASEINVEHLVIDWRRLNRCGVIIVDDCPQELHEKLSREITRSDSRLTLITIGNDLDTTAYAGSDTRLVVVKPTTSDAISDLLKTAFGKVSEQDRKFISAELADGHPQMAILVATARLANAPLTARLTPEVLLKLLGRDLEKDSPAEKVVSVCSLFEYIGVSGGLEHEREFVRQVFCPTLSPEEFYEHIIKFQKSGAITRYGRLAQVRPRPLAIRLAANWWEKCSPELAERIVSTKFPDGLAKAFCERLRMLDFIPSLKETTASLCGSQGPFGQAKVLNSELGSQLFRAIAEVNPLAAMDGLSNAFSTYDETRLHKVTGEIRRNLVWALEKLCFRKETFNSASVFLARLAAAENETWSNNATGVFARLFMILLPGTQASLEQRLPILLAVARDNSPSIQSVAIAALENALRSDHFIGTSGPEYQGSAGPLPQYRPIIWKEIFDYWSSCLTELVRIAVSENPLNHKAAEAIASNIRGLVLKGRLDDVEAAILSVAKAKEGVWPEGLDSIKDSLRYDSETIPDDGRKRISSWLEKLEPETLERKIALHVIAAPYEHEENEKGEWRDLAAERAEQLGVTYSSNWVVLLQNLSIAMKGAQRQAFMFGRGLAKGSSYSNDALNDVISTFESISIETRNPALLSGWLSALDEIDHGRVDLAFKAFSERKNLRTALPDICRGIKLNDIRLAPLVELLSNDSISPQQLHGLSYGRSMNAVTPKAVAQLCNTLLTKGIEGAWTALDIAFMYVFGDEEKWTALAPTLKLIVSTDGMLGNSNPKWRRDSHAFATVAKKLIGDDAELAAILTKRIVATAQQPLAVDFDHCLEEMLGTLLEKHLDVAWPILSDALSHLDGLAKLQLSQVLRNRFDDHDDAGLLKKIPLSYLKRWCTESPNVAPRVLAEIAQPLKKESDTKWELSEIVMLLINEHGSNPDVLSALQSNIGTYSWSGSLVPFYERQASVLEPLRQHSRENVRNWAERMIGSAKRQVDQESARDAEQEVGRY